MTRRRPHAGPADRVIAIGCGPTPRPQEPEPTPRDLVVLAPDPESGDVGRLVVTTAGRFGGTDAAPARAPWCPPAARRARWSCSRRTRSSGCSARPSAVQPPAAQHFNLYFELGGDQLTPASRAMVADVTAQVRGRTAIDVTVIGHTDTTGDTASNAALGLRRATLIRDLLIQAGLDGTVVDVRSHGESDPVVPTPDNTAEARNRRVEVTIR